LIRRHRLTMLALGIVCIAAGATVAGPAAAGGSSAVVSRSSTVVLSPRPGQRLRSYPIRLRVRAGDRLGALRVWLNGRAIQSQFGVTRRGVRSLQVSISQGLRRGANLLRVWVRRADGSWRKATDRFRLAVNRRLAGAGPDVRVVVGDPYMLEGSSVAAAGGPRRRRLGAAAGGVRWQLVAHPPNSAPPALSDATARNPTFVPDVPGRYTFRETVEDRLGSTSDEVTLAAVPDNPLVPIETMATEQGRDGIRVGSHFYPADPQFDARQPNYFQVLVLDRSTLGLVTNRTYTCPAPAPCQVDDIRTDLSHLNDSKLVIAAWHPTGRLIGTDSLTEFKRIGPPKLDPGTFIHSGNVSLIGVPGLPEGQANVKFAPDPAHTDGDMVGYLTPDQYLNFTWLPRDRRPFDTRAHAGAGDSHTFNIGGTLHKLSTLSSGQAGFHVVVVDGLTLGHERGAFFSTGSENQASQMAAFLRGVSPRELVFVASVGPAGKAPIDVTLNRPALNDLAAAIASVGGTRDAFNRAGITQDSNYSLVGWGRAGEGSGQETSSLKDPQFIDDQPHPGDGRLRGTLARDRQYLFRPASTSTEGQPPDALPSLVVAPPSSWPLAGNADVQKAIDYIGSRDKRLGADPRAAYWTQPFDQATWDQLAGVVRGVAWPGKGHGFTETEFTDARKELAEEMTWVGNVRAYLKNLSSPFGEDRQVILSKLRTISNTIKQALKPSADQRTTLKWLEITDAISKLLGRASAVTGVISSIYDLGVKYFAETRSGEDQTDAINDTVDGLTEAAARRLSDAQNAFRQIGDVIVGDYQKLKTAGTLGNCSPSADGCPRQWQFTGPDKTAAGVAASRSVEAQFDQAVMKLAFPAYLLGPRGDHTQARDYPCDDGAGNSPFTFYPFKNEPDTGQAALLAELPSGYDVYALANLRNLTAVNAFPNTPPKDVLDRMFGPVSPTLDAGAGGLGIDKSAFTRLANTGGVDYDNADKPFGHVCGGRRHGGWHNR
jgi:hypothetical protein